MSSEERRRASCRERAAPLARALVSRAVEKPVEVAGNGGRGLMSDVEDLAGHDGPHCGDDETALLEKLDDYGRAAFALGLAVGQLMSPAVCGKD
jgi:hypothetical protein